MCRVLQWRKSCFVPASPTALVPVVDRNRGPVTVTMFARRHRLSRRSYLSMRVASRALVRRPSMETNPVQPNTGCANLRKIFCRARERDCLGADDRRMQCSPVTIREVGIPALLETRRLSSARARVAPVSQLKWQRRLAAELAARSVLSFGADGNSSSAGVAG